MQYCQKHSCYKSAAGTEKLRKHLVHACNFSVLKKKLHHYETCWEGRANFQRADVVITTGSIQYRGKGDTYGVSNTYCQKGITTIHENTRRFIQIPNGN